MTLEVIAKLSCTCHSDLVNADRKGSETEGDSALPNPLDLRQCTTTPTQSATWEGCAHRAGGVEPRAFAGKTRGSAARAHHQDEVNA